MLQGLAETDFDLGLTGFDDRELAKILSEELETEPPKPSGPVVEAGDVWKLGFHRLMVGDEDIPAAERSIARWQESTGNTAVLEETGETFAQVLARRQPQTVIGAKPAGKRKPKSEKPKAAKPEQDADEQSGETVH